MNEWLQKQMQNGFRDLEGLSITGRIPVKDRLVNDLIAEALRAGSASAPAASPTPSAGPDVRQFLKFVKKAEVHATDGTIVLDFAVGI